MSGDALQLER